MLKLLSFRPIDRADAIELVALSEGLNEDYIGSRSMELKVEERWEEVKAASQQLGLDSEEAQ